jgi:hypothetical protein
MAADILVVVCVVFLRLLHCALCGLNVLLQTDVLLQTTQRVAQAYMLRCACKGRALRGLVV